MLSSAAREVEHRRGLVLGLTLAEVLLLLLFLLLLALGAQVSELREKLAASPDQDKTERQRLETQLAEVEAILAEAKKMNPNDPPAVLKRGLELSRRVGPEADLSQVQVVTPQTARLLEEASKLDARVPGELVVTRGIELIKKVGIHTPVEQVERVGAEMAKAIAAAREVDPHNPGVVLAHAIARANPSTEPEPKSPSGHHWPPIISLTEAEGFFFATNSSDLSPEFEAQLSSKVIGRLQQIVQQYGVNVIEVVGHTDEQPLAIKSSNLDRTLFPYLQGRPAERLIPADNVGLGLARAVAVLRYLSADDSLKELRIIPLSGAQLTTLGDRLSSGNPHAVEQRRRIEIRVRRSDREEIEEKPDRLNGSPPPTPQMDIDVPATGTVPKEDARPPTKPNEAPAWKPHCTWEDSWQERCK